jgi:type I restriction enzyme S subunit
VDTIPASDIASDARRLTATFYVPEDYRTANALRAAQDRHSELLVSLCKPGGVFSGPMFRRVLVDDPRFGLPYVTATDLEQAELRPAALISRKHGVLIERLTLRAGMITVSRSGMNLGKAFSVRSDMEGFVASDDLIRLVPDSNRIAPGYLFAFLDSRHGRMAIRRSLYGGSVRHIEPKHMKDLKVPRLPAEVENEANALALGAAEDLAEHTRLLESATADLLSERDLEEPNDGTWHTDESRLGWAERTVSADSLRALNYDPRARRLQDQLKSGRYDELITLCDPRWFKGFKVFTRVDALRSMATCSWANAQRFARGPRAVGSRGGPSTGLGCV